MQRHVFREGLVLAAIAVGLVGAAFAQDPDPPDGPPQAAASADGAEPAVAPGPPGVGDVLPESLPLRRPGERDDAGATISLADLSGEEQRPVVLVFWSSACPVCKRYEKVVAKIASDLGDRAAFLVVASGSEPDVEELRGLATRTSLRATLAVDPDGAGARSLGVRVTPTALVVDAARTLRYVGPLDDDRRARGRDAAPLLRPAVEAVADGKEPGLAAVRPFGSAIR